MTIQDENALLDDLQKGDYAAFERMYHAFKPRVSRWIFRWVKDINIAEELVQDVFVIVYQKIAGFERRSRFSTWLHTIAFNEFMMLLRRRQQVQHVHIDAIPDFEELTPDTRPVHNPAVLKEITNTIETMSHLHRQIITLKLLYGMEHQEIADNLKISTSNSKSRYRRALILLRTKLTVRGIR